MKNLFIIILFFVVSSLFGQRIYVSTSGDDAKDGLSEVNAVLTLSYAQSLASAGDTICLKKGDTWSSTSAVAINKSGISGSPIVWDGLMWGTGDTARITTPSSRGGTNNVALVHIYGCEYVTFENIEIDGNNQICYGVVIGGYDNTFSPGTNQQNNENHITLGYCGIKDIGDGTTYLPGVYVDTWYSDISNITITHNVINGTGSHGISFYPGKSQDGAPYLGEISNCEISYNNIKNYREYTGNVGNGIHINNKCTNIIIEHNIIGNGGGGQFALDQNEATDGYFPTNITIRYNNFTSTQVAGVPIILEVGQAVTAKFYSNIIYQNNIDGGGKGIWEFVHPSRTTTGQNIEIYNNTIITKGGHGARFDQGVTSTVTFKNNIIIQTNTGNGQDALNIATTGAVVHDHNLYYCNQVGTVYVTEGGSYYFLADMPTWEATSVTSDPTFVTDFTDLHLQTGSPAIGKGTAISGVTTDYDGVTYADPTRAIGALEYVSSTSTTVTGFTKQNGHWVKQNGHFIKH